MDAGAVSSSVSQGAGADSVDTALLKKAQDSQKQTVAALLQSMPQPGQVNTPAPGHALDVYA